jgi:hypothetical protein
VIYALTTASPAAAATAAHCGLIEGGPVCDAAAKQLHCLDGPRHKVLDVLSLLKATEVLKPLQHTEQEMLQDTFELEAT